ncbi:MAG: hypothetical protein PHO66_05090, partial [Eubacteriales bacterium]|nr:hypothetical protein [Eubacteriales bacterium]
AVVAVLGKLGSKLWEAATHNETFKSSLAQIKGNLAMAFQPIYQAALPALQALASWLAKVTNYIAQVMGALFGVSWGDAQKGVKGLEENVNGVGGAAKEAQKSLAGFDELTVLPSQRSGGGGGGGSGLEFGKKIELPQWLQDLIDNPRIQEALDSIKESWESIKESVKEVWPHIEPFVTWLKDNALDGVVRLFELFAAALEIIAGIFAGDWDKVLDGLKKFADASLPKWLKDLIDEWAPKFAKWVKDLPKTIEDAKKAIKEKVDEIKTAITEKWNAIVTSTREKWESVKNAIVQPIERAWVNTVLTVRSFVSNLATEWDNIKSKATEAWNNIKSAITDPIDAAKKTVQDAVDAIKRTLSGEVKWPNIKAPTVNLRWDTASFVGKSLMAMNLPGLPKFSVSWNAQGGILDRATLIGAGEAGKEAILPLDRNTGWMQQLADVINGGNGGGDIYITLDLDGEPVYRTVIKRAQAERRRTGLSPLPV